MGFILNLFPMNFFPLILVILYERADIAKKYINMDITTIITPENFLYMTAALLLATLSWEMVKATIYAPKGSGTWLDFMMSFLLLIAIILYIANIVMKHGGTPSKLILLVVEAQLFDVVVGFILAISNARRDLNMGG